MADLVYMLLLYKDWQQARRVIDRVDGPNVSFLIHIDRKTDDHFFDTVKADLFDHPNCHFIDRESVHWAAWGLVQAQLNGARYVEEHGIPCDFFIYMSGQDYPLVANSAINTFFDANKGKQFLENFPLPYSHWPRGGLERVKSLHVQVGKHHLAYPPMPYVVPDRYRPLMRRLPMFDRKLPGGYVYSGGSAAIILDGSGVSYLNSFLGSRLGRQLVRYFKLSRHADEIFFQTVFMNSELSGTVVNDELRYVDWNPPTGNPPKFLGMEDYDKLRTSGKLFGRKFSIAIDTEILDALDADAL